MQTTVQPKTLQTATAPTSKALAVIDLGNGLVKALIKAPGEDSFVPVSFPSHAIETDQSNSGCLRILKGKR